MWKDCDSAAGPEAELSVTGYAGGDSPGGAVLKLMSTESVEWRRAKEPGRKKSRRGLVMSH